MAEDGTPQDGEEEEAIMAEDTPVLTDMETDGIGEHDHLLVINFKSSSFKQ